MSAFSGNYPIEHRAGEIARLRLQSKAMEPDTLAMLDRFGSMEAGPVSILPAQGGSFRENRRVVCSLSLNTATVSPSLYSYGLWHFGLVRK